MIYINSTRSLILKHSKYICVFCGSSHGSNPIYAKAARLLGKEIAKRGFGLVYGGASVGIMGEIADTVLEAGSEVIGVIPERLEKEVAHKGLSKLHTVGTMHERKALMYELSDFFIALPGGFGTLDEIFEALTWAQLGYHPKPCGLLNTAGYYDELLNFLKKSVREGFIKKEHFEMLCVAKSPAALLDNMTAYRPPSLRKWF
ncbi:MAG: Rossman fold protein, TIGR00730 family [Lentisphaerae bacterium GWF2_45_14]|nr:MAG: Rossman fold protein, TIGR00730 family [Lentisphaerae bacterium GWF2_45_14]